MFSSCLSACVCVCVPVCLCVCVRTHACVFQLEGKVQQGERDFEQISKTIRKEVSRFEVRRMDGWSEKDEYTNTLMFTCLSLYLSIYLSIYICVCVCMYNCIFSIYSLHRILGVWVFDFDLLFNSTERKSERL